MVAMIVVVRAKGADLETVNPQALEGVPDAMSVSNLTQASLLHTVRERYNRDEVSITITITITTSVTAAVKCPSNFFTLVRVLG